MFIIYIYIYILKIIIYIYIYKINKTKHQALCRFMSTKYNYQSVVTPRETAFIKYRLYPYAMKIGYQYEKISKLKLLYIWLFIDEWDIKNINNILDWIKFAFYIFKRKVYIITKILRNH